MRLATTRHSRAWVVVGDLNEFADRPAVFRRPVFSFRVFQVEMDSGVCRNIENTMRSLFHFEEQIDDRGIRTTGTSLIDQGKIFGDVGSVSPFQAVAG